jgi:hypothetical protein
MKNGLTTNDNGDKFYYQDDLYHRLDGPAIIHNDGSKYWYQEDKLHRLDGPAIEHNHLKGHWPAKEWFYRGKKIYCSSQQEFERLLKLKAFW